MDDQDQTMDQAFLDNLKKKVLENLNNEQFSVEELSNEVGMSRSYLHRKLKLLKGKSVSQYIREIRLEEARELLNKDVATISEIAYRVGFNSPSYFNKSFQNFYGFPPGEFKKGNGTPLDLTETTAPEVKSFSRKRLRLMLSATLIIGVAVVIYFMTVTEKREPSIAVLPLDNLTGQSDNDYFVDGLGEALISNLGQVSDLRVISRSSSWNYKNTDALLPQIADELGVNTIVEGSVLGVGDTIRLLIQVIEVFPRERQIWAHEYSGSVENILSTYRNVVTDIAKKIDIQIAEGNDQERLVNPETYRAYLRGMHEMRKGTEASFQKGLDYLHKAIENDPGDPLAYAGLAIGYGYMGHGLSNEEAFNRATTAGRKAVRLDPKLDEANSAMASLYLYDVWDWEKARELFEAALAANPNNAHAHADYAWYHGLFYDKDRAIYHAEKAAILDPLSPTWHSWLSLLYFHFGETDKAEKAALQALALNENNPYGLVTLGWVYLARGQIEKAIATHERLPLKGSYWRTYLCETYMKTGHQEKAERLLEEMEEAAQETTINIVHRGIMAAYVGQYDKAFNYFNQGIPEKIYPLSYLDFYIKDEAARKDPRFSELLAKMNLPEKPVSL